MAPRRRSKVKQKAAAARQLTVRRERLRDLRPAAGNPKAHDLDAIEASLQRFGFVSPLIVDETTGELLAGHGRLEALIRMRDRGDDPPAGIKLLRGDWSVPTVRGVALAGEADAYRIADNRLVELGGWDDDALMSSLRSLEGQMEFEGIGFDADDLAALVDRLEGPREGETDPDATPALPDEARSTLGEVYELGPHRVNVWGCDRKGPRRGAAGRCGAVLDGD